MQKFLYKEIGTSLNISDNTAKKALNIYNKPQVNSRDQALDLACEKGMQ